MKPLLLASCLVAAALPLRAQSLFVVTENGVRYPVRAIADGHPVVEDHGKLRPSRGLTYSFAPARMWGRGLLNVDYFQLHFSSVYTNVGDREIRVFGRLKSDTDLHHCFVVIKMTDAFTGVFFAELPDLPAGQEVVYDRLFPLPGKDAGGEVHSTLAFYADGLPLLTTRMNPMYVQQQRRKTEAFFERRAQAAAPGP